MDDKKESLTGSIVNYFKKQALTILLQKCKRRAQLFIQIIIYIIAGSVFVILGILFLLLGVSEYLTLYMSKHFSWLLTGTISLLVGIIIILVSMNRTR